MSKYHMAKSSSMHDLSATYEFISLLSLEINLFSSNFLKQRYEIVMCLSFGIFAFYFSTEAYRKMITQG